jgi:hypothetical protein
LKGDRRFGGTYRFHLRGRRISRTRNRLKSRWQADIQLTTRRYIPKDSTLHNHRCTSHPACVHVATILFLPRPEEQQDPAFIEPGSTRREFPASTTRRWTKVLFHLTALSLYRLVSLSLTVELALAMHFLIELYKTTTKSGLFVRQHDQTLNNMKNSEEILYWPTNNKKFCEELIAYFPWYDTGHIENDASNNSSIVARVFVTAVTFLPNRCLATIGKFLSSRRLETIGGYTYRHTVWWEWFFN